MIKYTLKILFILAFLPTPALAGFSLPDLYIEAMHFSKCSDQDIGMALMQRGDEMDIIYAAEDGSYFDIARKPDPDTGYIGNIYRTYCFTYSVGNKGEAEIITDLGSSSEDRYPWEQFTINDPKWFNVDFHRGSVASINLKPGDFYSETGHIEVSLNDNAHSGQNCIGISIDLKAEELDTTNNRKTLCFEQSQYSFPKAPQNFIVTKAEDQILELTWDEVEGADSYKVRATNVAANADFKILDPVSVSSNKAFFEFPNPDLHCITVSAVNDGLVSAESHRFCYGTLIWRFKDVPIDSWYFPYMQELQANGVIDGYKDEAGNHTGYFGPADNLTVAEALKIALSFNKQVRLYDAFDTYPKERQEGVIAELGELKTFFDGDFEAPPHLKGHWAEELFKKAYGLKLTIAQDLQNLDPNRPITRGEIMELLAESFEAEIPQSDAYSLSDIENTRFADLIEYYYQKNYINGYPDGTFKVDGPLNRAEAVKIINNFRSYRGH